MLGMKHVRAVRVAAMGLLGCLILAVLPVGCTKSIEMAPVRYRAQHQNARHLLRDITVERLQECVEKYGYQLQSESIDVEATVQVDDEGRHKGLVVKGIPDSAPDLAACTRITLGEMGVPTSVLQLRYEQTASTTNGQTKPMGNALANPIVMWEIAAALAEFAAQHGGKAVLYSVTIEVLSAAAIAGATVYVARRKKKDRCTDYYEACVASSLWHKYGRHQWDSLCSLCAGVCFDNNGEWPSTVAGKDCTYKGN